MSSTNDPEKPLPFSETYLDNKLRDEKPIGEGSFGYVYRVEGVVIKRMEKSIVSEGQARHEISMQAQAHKAAPDLVPKIYNKLIKSEENLFIVMEWIDGEDLSVLWESSDWRKKNFETVIGEVKKAVSRFKAVNLEHRDLKPDNIKVTPENKVKILDFGLAEINEKEDSIDAKAIAMMIETSEKCEGIHKSDSTIAELLIDYRDDLPRQSEKPRLTDACTNANASDPHKERLERHYF